MCRRELDVSGDCHRDPTRRFSDRVAHYVRYRPGYPPALMDVFRQELGLEPSHSVADVGSGTGKLSELLLRNGNAVFGIEPNREMREAAEAALREFPRFSSVDGSAESTGLEADSVDHVVAAQAFHWFRADEARMEFARIGRPGSWTALVWNRRLESSPFLRAYESLLHRFSLDYAAVDHRKKSDPGTLRGFFGGGHHRAALSNAQSLDWAGLRGRVLSSSYAPLPGQSDHDAMFRELQRTFDAYHQDGRVTFEYETEVYWGRLVS
jgi:SAM-dependent methyltransferase